MLQSLNQRGSGAIISIMGISMVMVVVALSLSSKSINMLERFASLKKLKQRDRVIEDLGRLIQEAYVKGDTGVCSTSMVNVDGANFCFENGLINTCVKDPTGAFDYCLDGTVSAGSGAAVFNVVRKGHDFDDGFAQILWNDLRVQDMDVLPKAQAQVSYGTGHLPPVPGALNSTVTVLPCTSANPLCLDCADPGTICINVRVCPYNSCSDDKDFWHQRYAIEPH